MLLMGFRQDWLKDWGRTQEYVNIWQQAYKLKLSVLVLRTPNGLDFSEHIVDEELVEPEDMDPVEIVRDFSRRLLKPSASSVNGKVMFNTFDSTRINWISKLNQYWKCVYISYRTNMYCFIT